VLFERLSSLPQKWMAPRFPRKTSKRVYCEARYTDDLASVIPALCGTKVSSECAEVLHGAFNPCKWSQGWKSRGGIWRETGKRMWPMQRSMGTSDSAQSSFAI